MGFEGVIESKRQQGEYGREHEMMMGNTLERLEGGAPFHINRDTDSDKGMEVSEPSAWNCRGHPCLGFGRMHTS